MIYTEELVAKCSCIKVSESFNGPDGYGKTSIFVKEYTPNVADVIINPNALREVCNDGEMFFLWKHWLAGVKTYAQIAKYLNNINKYFQDPIIKLYT